MPGPMPGHLSKGTILAKLDEVLEKPGDSRRAELLQRLEARNPDRTWTEPVVEVLEDVLGLDRGEVAHLRNHWFDERKGWWSTQQPIDIIVRLGLIHVIQLADAVIGSHKGTEPRPVDCYWMCGTRDVTVSACVSPAQVTAIILTPAPPVSDRIPSDYTGATQLEPIYTTRAQSRGPGEQEVVLPQDWVEFVQPIRA